MRPNVDIRAPATVPRKQYSSEMHIVVNPWSMESHASQQPGAQFALHHRERRSFHLS